MRVVAKRNNWRDCPALARSFSYPADGRFRWLAIGESYDVQAIASVNGIVEFQIISSQWPYFAPAALFEIIENGFPDDWVCKVFNDDRLQMVLGPEFMAKDIESFSATVEMNPPQSDLFWERVKRIESRKPKGDAKVLLDNWVQCPFCEEAWEVGIEEALVKCPKCSTVLDNPLYSAK